MSMTMSAVCQVTSSSALHFSACMLSLCKRSLSRLFIPSDRDFDI